MKKRPLARLAKPMDREELTRLNLLLRQALGCEGSQSRFKWQKLSDMRILRKEGVRTHGVPVEGESGEKLKLYVATNDYSWFSQAELYGFDGWAMTCWRPPMVVINGRVTILDQIGWARFVGDFCPFPARGEYYPVGGNTVLPADEIPTRLSTDYFIEKIKPQIDMSYEAWCVVAEARAQEKENEITKLADDMTCDLQPAFLSIPGKKDVASFPGVRKD